MVKSVETVLLFIDIKFSPYSTALEIAPVSWNAAVTCSTVKSVKRDIVLANICCLSLQVNNYFELQ